MTKQNRTQKELEMKNEGTTIEDNFWFHKKDVEEHLDRKLTTDEWEELREKVHEIDMYEFMYWILDYLYYE